MYVSTILETRVGDRVYKLDQCKQSTFEGPLVEWRVGVVADAGSYRASELHNTIIAEVVSPSREQAVSILNAIVTTALDTVASPFDS